MQYSISNGHGLVSVVFSVLILPFHNLISPARHKPCHGNTSKLQHMVETEWLLIATDLN